MRWNRRQIAAVSVIPIIALAWTIMRFVQTASVSDRPAPETSGAAATPDSPPLARREPPPMVTSAEVTTDDAGRFQLRGLATGTYRVTFGEPTDRAYTRLDGVQVNDLYGANLLNLKLQSASQAGTLGTDEYQPNKLPHVIRGSVVNARGEPVPGIRVRAQRQ